jgi:hypothetical protein
VRASSRATSSAGVPEHGVAGPFQAAERPAQGGAESGGAGVDVPVPCLHEAVGVEGEDRALGQVQLRRLEGEAADAQHRSRHHVDDVHPAVGPYDHGRYVARRGDRAGAGHRVVHRVQAGGADLPAAAVVARREVFDEVVEVGEEFVGRQVDVGERPHGRAQPAHGDRGVDAVSHDVPDDQGDPGAGQRDHVEPVTAHPGLRQRGQIAGGEVDGRLACHRPRQQAALEGERGGAFPGVPAGVVHTDGGPAAQLLGEDHVVLVEGVGMLGREAADEHGDAQGGAAGDERYGHEGQLVLRGLPELGGAGVVPGEPGVEVVVAGPGEDGLAAEEGAGGRRERRIEVG